MAWFSADFHIHSCLSPCGDLSSSPRVIAETASDAGLDLVGLTDHNSTMNCPAFDHHTRRLGLGAMFGMEATCAEEAHVLCLFGDVGSAIEAGEWAYGHLAPVTNDPAAFGDQVWVDIEDEIQGEVEKFLVGALDVGLSDLEREIHRRGGLVIPAHVDRSAMSLMSQLGYIPPGTYDGLELLRMPTRPADLRMTGKFGSWTGHGLSLDDTMYDSLMDMLEELGYMPGLAWQDALLDGRPPFVPAFTASSDAHFPADIGQRRTLFWAEQADFHGFREALAHGRALGIWKVKP